MLRNYQTQVVSAIDDAWATQKVKNIIAQLPTGAGKTRIMAHLAKRHVDIGGFGVAIAHRGVLVGQLSMALAELGVPHDIIAQKKVVETIVGEHMEEVGRSYYVPGARFKVCSVDTLPGRADLLTSWIAQCTLGFTDEAHHVLADNKWGRECMRFTNPEMRWVLPTATPERADGKGLGRDSGGIADIIVNGPTMAWLIAQGYLTDFALKAPIPSDLDLSAVDIGANGEYNLKQLRAAVHKSKKILGNVVDTYKRFTPGMLGIAFAVDIEHAIALTKEFNDKGVPAELITGDKDDEDSRRKKLKRYRKRETLVLVNVDLFGEGFDLPAIEVVMMARPTASYALFAQQFGRGLRLGVGKEYLAHWEDYTAEQRLAIIAASPKPVAHIHDHVGNVLHFKGPPTVPREFSLGGRTGRGPSDAIPLRVCLNPNCLQPFERFYTHCPFCGFNVPPPPITTLPAQVDGDILLYTAEMLQRLFGVSTVTDALAMRQSAYPLIPPNMTSPAAVRSRQANHHRMHIAQRELDALMPLLMPPRYSERENQRRFFLNYGCDVVQARLLAATETEELVARIKEKLSKS